MCPTRRLPCLITMATTVAVSHATVNIERPRGGVSDRFSSTFRFPFYFSCGFKLRNGSALEFRGNFYLLSIRVDAKYLHTKARRKITENFRGIEYCHWTVYIGRRKICERHFEGLCENCDDRLCKIKIHAIHFVIIFIRNKNVSVEKLGKNIFRFWTSSPIILFL